MTDRTVLTHYVLVLEHDARAGAIVRAGVRAAHEVHDLVCFDARRARIDRVRPDAGQVVDLEYRDGAVALHADLCLDAMIARMNVGDEALEPIGHKLHRALEHPR